MSFVRNERAIKWSASASPSQPNPSVAFATADVLEELLQHFSALFAEPTSLPPKRHCSHQIRLLPSMPPVAVRPYRYMHH
jgi:hypothetical protein